MLQHSFFSLFWHLLQFWLRLSLSSAKCDGRTGIFWQTAHRWSMKKKKKSHLIFITPFFWWWTFHISCMDNKTMNIWWFSSRSNLRSPSFLPFFLHQKKTGKMHKICRQSKYMRYIKVFLLKKKQVWPIYSLQKLCQMVGFIYRPISQLRYYGFWFSAFCVFPSAIHTSLLETLRRKIT